ncbi:HNH endonuclease [Arthrobacter phage Renna12]|nr:HNH endonuclease [Arthrobacter phage Renna12]
MAGAAGAAAVRNTRRQKAIKAELRARRDPCWLCGEAIDYTLPDTEPRGFSADHVKPWSTHPELREDPANYRAAHLVCNQKRSNGEAPAGLGYPSREW